ncbi:sialidase family protein [Aureliella helgolandensis]|nr:sialidase family protein [Aureliella helgolandensis]
MKLFTNRIILLALSIVVVAMGNLRAQDSLFLEPPQYIGPPKALQAVTNRAFAGIPSLAVSKGGRLWATWYAGKTPGEDLNNYVVLSTSGDGGTTWKEVLVVDPDAGGPVRAYDPELWIAPDGKLRLVWAQAIGHMGNIAGVWFLEIEDPEAEQPLYGKPERVTDGVMMCKPLVLSTGEWALPASTWRTTDESARMIVSSDQGKSWSRRGGCNVPEEMRAFDEHMFIERRDESIWLLVRTKYGIGESVSNDRGKTWPELTPSAIAHPSARFFVRRLASGNLLLVKHGPIDERTGRSHLMAFISKDDGKNWTGGLMLDDRAGVSYPDGQQDTDGVIHIIYDYSRTGDRHILFASFREEDVAAGRAVTDSVKLRQLVREASGGVERKMEPPSPVKKHEDGKELKAQQKGALSIDEMAVEPFDVGATLFTDRGYALAERPKAFDGAVFLCVPIEGKKAARCTQSGMVYFLSPEPDRNGDSQSHVLLEQGFEKVALPEVRLFDLKRSANYCTVYQKHCEKADTIEFGKWAVPVFFRN